MGAKACVRLVIVIAVSLVAVAPSLAAPHEQASKARQAQQVFKQNQPRANNGDASAQYNMGVLYDRGYGVKRDYAKARQWYEKAAAQHYARAEHNLGILYQQGKGVPRDLKKAVHWFRRGADDGQTDSQNNLAVLYMRGEGVPQNTGKAAFWAARAAAGGNSAALDNLTRIIADLPHVHANIHGVHVHDQPDHKARVVGRVGSDRVVVVLSRDTHWTQILLSNNYVVGWVASDLLSDSQAPLAGQHLPRPENRPAAKSAQATQSGSNNGPQVATSPAATREELMKRSAGQSGKGHEATVSVALANVRQQADGGEVVGRLRRGTQVRLLDEHSGWHKIETEGGMKGWIAGYLLNIR